MFNNKQKHHLSEQTEAQKLIQFIIRAQQIAQQDSQQDRGYAMVIVSIVSVVMFSLLGAYLLVTNITKSSTNAYVDGTNTFYAAESGLNKRADQLRQKFVGYRLPTGLSPGQTVATDPVSPANIANCFSVATNTTVLDTASDFECRNYAFKYNSNSANVTGSGGSVQATNISKQIDYTAFTFVADKTIYDPTSAVAAPVPSVIPSGQLYAGLNSQQYRYTVYSTAAKVDPTNPASSLQRGDAQTVLQMDFKSQIIPLFQFAAFYDRDLEIDSTTPMTLTGRVHTNANLYVQPTPVTPNPVGTTGIDFLNKVTVAGDIYNRVDASPYSAGRVGTTRIFSGTTSAPFPAYKRPPNPLEPLSTTEMNTLLGQVANKGNGVQQLNPPQAGFLRKRNYLTNQIGEYFGKADLRLQMTPNSPIPFKFTAIQSGANAKGETCVTTFTSGQDPAQNYIDSTRQGSNFKCHNLSLGEITSLQQPVLVLTRDNAEEEARFCAKPTDGSTDRLRDILNYASVTADTTTNGLSDAKIDKVLRALQVAISARRKPVDYQNVSAAGTLPPDIQATFATLLGNITLNLELTPGQIDTISKASPASIAKARKSCFLPAPIVRVARNLGYNGNTPPTPPDVIPTPAGGGGGGGGGTDSGSKSFLPDLLGIRPANAATTIGPSYGLYDQREGRWIQTLQTNIESLTVWNRDGRFVNLPADLTVAADLDTQLIPALTSGDSTIAPTNPPAVDAFSGNSVLFLRAPASGSIIGSFDRLGLAAADKTERGLVLHAHVDDFLDGVNTGTPDVVASTRGIKQKNSDGTEVVVDYYRTYPSSVNVDYPVTPYAFAFNGGRNLPGAMTIASDQSVYLQGDYNTIAKKPAAIMADTITALSVNCVSRKTEDDPSKIPTANVNCLIFPWEGLISGNSPWTGGSLTKRPDTKMYIAQTTTVNAAFLSFTAQSFGNLGQDRDYGTSSPLYSGGLNNYMRFMEDWDSGSFNYSGSLVSLATPLEFGGRFRAGSTQYSYFNPPDRNFNYDASFNAFLSLPPMTPSVVYLQQDVFRRN